MEKEEDFSIRVVFIVSSSSAPPGGQLLGDIFYVNVPDGYYNIVQKVKHMMGLVSRRGSPRHRGVSIYSNTGIFLANVISR